MNTSTPTTFELHRWTTRGNDLLTRARQLLASATDEKTRLLAGEVSERILASDKRVSLVFAGQYSAGKSSLIKSLTGREDIAIGAGITTDRTHAYDWDGITIVDTPGIHTELRPDHDEIAYKAIVEADLLGFVVTNELFDAHLAEHFRQLAIERDKVHEMMLVVNKMRRCATGNSPEAQVAICEDLSRVLVPFTPEDVRITFTDADAALQSKTEPDQEIAAILWKKSGFAQFVQELNRFVREKRLSSRYTTALYRLEQVLIEALANESTGDPTVDAIEEMLLQERRAVLDTKQQIIEEVEMDILITCSQIRQEGNRVAEMIHASADIEAVNQELQAAQKRVDELVEHLDESIRSIIGRHVESLDSHLHDIFDSELAKALSQRLESLREATLSNGKTIVQISGMPAKLGDFLLKHSFKPGTGTLESLFKLGSYSGTKAHDFIKTIGHFFGKSFKPWEAVKWTRYAANFGRFLGVAGIALPLVMQTKENIDVRKRERELRERRSDVRAMFNEVANNIEIDFKQLLRAYISSNITPQIDQVTAQLEEFRDSQRTRSQLFQDLHNLLKETRELIRDIHSSNQKAT